MINLNNFLLRFLKLIFFIPVLCNFYFQLLIVALSNKKTLIIKADYYRMGQICSQPGRYIYFRKNYNLIVIHQDHFASFIFEFSIKLFRMLLNRDKVVTAICDQKADEFWNFNLAWNNVFDLLGEKSITTDVPVLRNKIDNKLVLKFPLLKEKNIIQNLSKKLHIVYIGSIDPDIDINTCDSNCLLEDSTLTQYTENIVKFEKIRQRTRLYFVKTLKEYYGNLFKVYGNKYWGNYNIHSEFIGWKKKDRFRAYASAGICVDFLGQNSNTSIITRSIEIFNAGALLVQWKSFQSEEVFGIEYSNQFCFTSISELKEIIDNIIFYGLNYYKEIREKGLDNLRNYQEITNTNCILKCIDIQRLNYD